MSKLKKTSYIIGWLICIIGAVFYWYEYLLRIVPSVMVNELMGLFNISASGFGTLTALYYFAYTPMQLTAGVLLDRYGTRIMIGIAIVSCVLGSFLFGLTSNIFVAGIARFLIGFGSSFAFVGVLALGAEWLPKKHFTILIGIATSLGMLAGMTGDVVLTSLMHTIGWKNILMLATIIGAILIPIIFIFVHDTPNAKHSTRLDLTFRETFGGLKQIIKNPQMWICGIIASTMFLSLSAFAELWGIEFLQTAYTLEEKQASYASAAVFLGWLVAGPFVGWISDRIKSRKKPLLIGGIFSAICIALVILRPFEISFTMLCILLFLYGCFSSAEIVCFAIAKEISSSQFTATALAFNNFLIMLGGLICQPLIGFLLDLTWDGKILDGVRIYAASDYQMVFLLIPICLVVSIFLNFKLKESLQKA